MISDSDAANQPSLRPALERALEHRGIWLVAVIALTLLHFARIYDPERALMTDTRYFSYFATLVAGTCQRL